MSKKVIRSSGKAVSGQALSGKSVATLKRAGSWESARIAGTYVKPTKK
jgi:hypothetical protein